MKRPYSIYSASLGLALILALAPGLHAHAQIDEDGLTFIQIFFNNVDDLMTRGSFRATISPDGNDVYVSARSDRGINHFARNATTGELTFVAFVETEIDPKTFPHIVFDIVVSPNGNFLYAALDSENGIPGRLARYDRDPATGELTLAGALTEGEDGVEGLTNALYLAQSPDGRHLYVLARPNNSSSLAVFATDPTSGDMSFVQVVHDQPDFRDGLLNAREVTVSPDGLFVYVSGGVDEVVAVYARDETTGALTQTSHILLATEGFGLTEFVTSTAISPDGLHAYALANSFNKLFVLERDIETGALTILDEIQDITDEINSLNGPERVLVSPAGDRVYVVSRRSLSHINVYARDQQSGLLTLIESLQDARAGFEVLLGAGTPVLSPDGAHLYLPSSDSDTIAAFSTEGSPIPCRDLPLAQTQYDLLAAQLGLSEDLDEDGLPELASITLIETAACLPEFNLFIEATLDAFLINRSAASFDILPIDPVAPEFPEAVAALMMISEDVQTALRIAFENVLSPLQNFYLVTQCDPEGNCDAVLIDEIPELNSTGTRVPSPSEIFSGAGDPDGDGITNEEEYANTIARGGSLTEFAIAALDPFLDGTEIPAPTDGSSGICFIATAAYGTPLADEIGVLRNLRDTHFLDNALGTALTDTYYRLSPAVADVISTSATGRAIVRTALTPIILLSTLALAHPLATPAAAFALTVALLIAVARRRRTTRI